MPRIVGTLPHDSAAFTQGLFYYNGILYESTGLYEHSTLRTLDTANGSILSQQSIGAQYFAEGCALLGNQLFQLTWQEEQCFIYSLPSRSCIDTISYSGEGWGLTSRNSELIMSNGSDTIYFRNSSFDILKKLPVSQLKQPLANLNELEFARGYIYANVWFSDYIFEIDPQSGSVQRIIDCSELVALEKPASDQAVLNGIAYNPKSGLFYITGKNWKNIFIVQIPQ